MIKNENIVDRGIRLLLSSVFFVGSFFWFSGILQIIGYVLFFVLLVTSITGFCLLYKVFKIDTNKSPQQNVSKITLSFFVMLLIGILVGGSYYSVFFTKKFFLEDYNRMNEHYKQTLFYTGQNKRTESVENYQKLVTEYSLFLTKYTQYHPFSISQDSQFNTDIKKVSEIISGLNQNISSGDLPSVHKELEAVRPIFQDILKRNNFSLLAISLVDFHDSMEKIISSADLKDPAGVISNYTEVDAKLKEVEASANDSEIKLIRQKLEELVNLAKNNQADLLSAKAAELKSAFVKVYLQRG